MSGPGHRLGWGAYGGWSGPGATIRGAPSYQQRTPAGGSTSTGAREPPVSTVSPLRFRLVQIATAPSANPLGALAAGARDDLAERLEGGAIKFLKLHLLNRREIIRAGVDSDAGQ